MQPERSSAASPARAAARSIALVDPRPRRVQLDEPLEQRRLLREPARRPLVEVVVAVDQPGRGEAARARRCRVAVAGAPAGPDRDDPVALDDDVPVAVHGAGDRRDRAALEDQPTPPPAAPRRGSSRSPCSGRGCRPAPRGSRRRSATGCAPAGRGWRRSGPGVQKPHCTAPASRNASWIGCSSSSTARAPRPSRRRAPRPAPRRPGRSTRARRPGRREHEPHSPCSHAFLEPGSCIRSRSTYSSDSPSQSAVDLARLAVDRAAQPHRCPPGPRQGALGQHARARAAGTRRFRARRRSARPPPRPARRSVRRVVIGQPRPVEPPRRTPPPRSARIGVGPAEPMHVPTRPSGHVQRERADRDHHRVARPDLRELLRPARGRHPHRRDQLVVGEHVALGPDDEVVDRHAARPAHRRQFDLRADGVQRRQRVARGRGGSEVPPDRPAVADLRRADRPRRHRQPGQPVAELAR